MQQTENHNEVLKNQLAESFTFKSEQEDEDLFDFDFKPVNKGLGFHNEQKRVTQVLGNREASSPIKAKTNNLDRGHDSLANFYKKNVARNEEVSTKNLGSFYGAEKAPITEKKITIKPRIIEAQMHICFFAWLVDIAIITLSFGLTAIGFTVLSGIDFTLMKSLVSFEEMMIFGSVIYTIFYIMYFTVLDLVATPGNALFGLKLLRLNNEDVRVTQTLLRACSSYFALITGFIIYFLNFQNKLSETKLAQT